MSHYYKALGTKYTLFSSAQETLIIFLEIFQWVTTILENLEQQALEHCVCETVQLHYIVLVLEKTRDPIKTFSWQ